MLMISSSVLSQSVVDSSRYIFIQGGYLNVYESPSLNGFQTLNFRYLKPKSKKLAWGVDLHIHTAANDEILDRQVVLLDSVIFFRTGGDRNYLEVGLNLLRMKKLAEYKETQFGIISSFGYAFVKLDNDLTPEGGFRKENFHSIKFKLNPYVRTKINDSFELFVDANFINITYGLAISEFTPINGMSKSYIYEFDGRSFNEVHIGIIYRL